MSQDYHDRLARYAVFSVFHGVVSVAALIGDLSTGYGVLLLVASLPLFWAWGAFQGDLAMNPCFDQAARNRWMIALWLLPWSMSLYWYRYVRVAPTA